LYQYLFLERSLNRFAHIIQSKKYKAAMKLVKKILPLVILVAFAFASQSCNKGIGCPSDFSMNQPATSVVK